MKYHNYNGLKINLGGGGRKKKGYITLDILEIPEVDIVCDINDGIPLPDNSVSNVYARHFFEHIDDTVALMEEIYRVSKPNAEIKIIVPYFTSTGAFKDPTHVSFFTEKTFEYFDKAMIEQGMLPGYDLKANFKIIDIRYMWSSGWLRILPFKKTFWMKHLWNIARTMTVTLRVVK